VADTTRPYAEISYETADRVATITLSRPDQLNAFTRVFDAAEALRGGLVARTYPAGELLPAAYALAREIADNTSAVAVAASRQLMWRMLGAGSPWEAHRLDSRAIHLLGQGPDVAEGVAAFLEKRPPQFPMRVSAGLPDLGPRWPEPPDHLTDSGRPGAGRRRRGSPRPAARRCTCARSRCSPSRARR
jgi:1,4-dihydroxy-2-naphthoyl-CoA synthase